MFRLFLTEFTKKTCFELLFSFTEFGRLMPFLEILQKN
jgi:hypothetical protein